MHLFFVRPCRVAAFDHSHALGLSLAVAQTGKQVVESVRLVVAVVSATQFVDFGNDPGNDWLKFGRDAGTAGKFSFL